MMLMCLPPPIHFEPYISMLPCLCLYNSDYDAIHNTERVSKLEVIRYEEAMYLKFLKSKLLSLRFLKDLYSNQIYSYKYQASYFHNQFMLAQLMFSIKYLLSNINISFHHDVRYVAKNKMKEIICYLSLL